MSEEMEKALGSVGRLRILKFLTKNPTGEPTLSVYRLRTLAGLRTKGVKNHLKVLVNCGWVKEVPTDSGKKYRLNRENPKVEALINFYREVNYLQVKQ